MNKLDRWLGLTIIFLLGTFTGNQLTITSYAEEYSRAVADYEQAAAHLKQKYKQCYRIARIN